MKSGTAWAVLHQGVVATISRYPWASTFPQLTTRVPGRQLLLYPLPRQLDFYLVSISKSQVCLHCKVSGFERRRGFVVKLVELASYCLSSVLLWEAKEQLLSHTFWNFSLWLFRGDGVLGDGAFLSWFVCGGCVEPVWDWDCRWQRFGLFLVLYMRYLLACVPVLHLASLKSSFSIKHFSFVSVSCVCFSFSLASTNLCLSKMCQ